MTHLTWSTRARRSGLFTSFKLNTRERNLVLYSLLKPPAAQLQCMCEHTHGKACKESDASPDMHESRHSAGAAALEPTLAHIQITRANTQDTQLNKRAASTLRARVCPCVPASHTPWAWNRAVSTARPTSDGTAIFSPWMPSLRSSSAATCTCAHHSCWGSEHASACACRTAQGLQTTTLT